MLNPETLTTFKTTDKKVARDLGRAAATLLAVKAFAKKHNIDFRDLKGEHLEKALADAPVPTSMSGKREFVVSVDFATGEIVFAL